MESRSHRSWSRQIGVAAMFIFIGMSSCDTEDPTDVRPEETQAPENAQVSAKADSTGSSTEDNCYWVDGQWICYDS